MSRLIPVEVGGKAEAEPFDLGFFIGETKVTFTVRPVGQTDINAARAAAARRLGDKERAFAELKEEGAVPEGFPDLDDPDVKDGFFETLLARELAVRQTVAWEGLGNADGSAPLALNRGAVIAVLDLFPLEIGDVFYRRLTALQVVLNAAKKGCGPSPIGTSTTGPDTASGAVTKTGSPAPTAPTGQTKGRKRRRSASGN